MVRLQRSRRRGASGEGDPVPTDELVDDAGDHDVADEVEEPDEEPDEEPRRTSVVTEGLGRRRLSPRSWTPLLLLQTTHPKQAVVTALALGGVAVLTGREPREVGVIVCTVLVGQAMLGWHNDVVDRRKDQDNQAPGKPVADGRLDPGTVWYAIVAAFWVLLPLAVTTGITAGCIYMGSVAVGMLGNVLLRTGFFSWWSWAVSFAMLPAYLSYGGWGGQALGSPPETSITVLAALLGIGVHFTRSVWGLVADHAEGWTYLPLKLGLKIGATRLLMLSTLYTVVIVVLVGVFGARDGLAR
ncbi:MAG TPA: UbiA family prenyltransferase [Nocardioides sp.]|nr:UbiA family prenyltransferase [Nocardioides sp.]